MVRLKQLISKHWLLIVLFLAFNFLFGGLLWWNWEQLRFGAWDLGIHDQIFYLYSRGIFAPSSFTQLPAPFWDSHFRPTAAIFVLQYLIWPSPLVFLVLQVFIFSLGVIPLYLTALRYLGSKLPAIALSFAYLSYPGAISALAFPGHSENLVATFVSWALFFYLQGKRKKFFTFFLMAAVSQENISLYLAGLSLFMVVRKDKKLALVTFLTSLGYGLVVIKYLIPWRLGQDYVPAERYFETFTGFAPLFVSPAEKMKTVVLSLLNFGFLPLASGAILGAPAISLVVRFLSNRRALWGLVYHYNVFLTPFLAYASLLGLERLREKASPFWFKKGLVLVSALLFFLPVLINLRFGQRGYRYLEFNFFQFQRLSKPERQRIHALLAKIPKDASVSAQDPVIPLLTHREHVYSLRRYSLAEYIPIDLSLKFPTLMTSDGVRLTRLLIDAPDYQIVECSDWLLLLKKGPDQGPKKKCLGFRENLKNLR